MRINPNDGRKLQLLTAFVSTRKKWMCVGVLPAHIHFFRYLLSQAESVGQKVYIMLRISVGRTAQRYAEQWRYIQEAVILENFKEVLIDNSSR